MEYLFVLPIVATVIGLVLVWKESKQTLGVILGLFLLVVGIFLIGVQLGMWILATGAI